MWQRLRWSRLRRGEFGSAAEVPWRQLACRRRKPISEAAPLCSGSGLLCGGGLCGLILAFSARSAFAAAAAEEAACFATCCLLTFGSSSLFRGGSSLGLHLDFGSGRLFLSTRRALSFGTFSEVAALFVCSVLSMRFVVCACTLFFGRRRSERQMMGG